MSHPSSIRGSIKKVGLWPSIECLQTLLSLFEHVGQELNPEGPKYPNIGYLAFLH